MTMIVGPVEALPQEIPASAPAPSGLAALRG
jgi:hypothetical protein